MHEMNFLLTNGVLSIIVELINEGIWLAEGVRFLIAFPEEEKKRKWFIDI